VASWMEFDPTGASQWVESLPQGVIRQSASSRLVWALIGQEDFESAWAWAQETGNDDQRLRQYARIVTEARKSGAIDLIKPLVSETELSRSERENLNEALDD
jgi:hypothetical protein